MDMNLTLQKSCELFSQQTVLNVARLLNHNLSPSHIYSFTDQLDQSQTLYFSIPFQGEVSGEFIFGMDTQTAISLIHAEDETLVNFEEIKEDIFDIFKEILNWSVGQTIGSLESTFEKITIAAPKVTLGEIHFPKVPMYKSDLRYGKSKISCYIYMDSMMTDLISALKETQKQNQKLEGINKAKSDFLAHMSHELRTPLNGIIGIIDLLKNTSLNEYQTRQLETVSKSGDLLLGIINDILEFSKIEKGKLELETTPFDLRDSLEHLIETMAPQIYSKGLEFHLDIPAEIPCIIGDETKIKQVLVNLIGNAIKFTPNGSIQFTVQIIDNKQIHFSVKDSGVGIPKDRIESIFYSFSQADISDTRKYGGSGLGLSICKSIVERMGGQIHVESQEAEGSTFSFNIPIQTQSHQKYEPLPSTAPVHLLLQREEDEQWLSREIEALTKKTPQRIRDTATLMQNNIPLTDSLIIDWSLWNKMTEKERQSLKECRYVGFYIPPNCLPDIEWNKEQFTDIEGGFLIKPALRKNLSNILTQVNEINPEQVSKENPQAPITMNDHFEETKDSQILVVDDNAINVEVARVMLASQGYNVDVAFDGEQALAKVKQKDYDLIIMDCQMPKMDGYDATKAIRHLSTPMAQVPIIGFTANAFKEVKQKCFDSGMTDFVTKPIKQEKLVELIKKYVLH